MIRLGLVGHARVAERAVIRPLRDDPRARVTAVAGRDPGRAAEFARMHGVPHAFASVDELLRSDVVDAVYVSLPHALHARAICDAITASRHVLVEKPLALTASDAARVASEAAAAGVVVLEGIMVQYHPWQARLREVLDAGGVGPVHSIDSRICFPLPPERIARLPPPALGGGVFCDVAPYWLQFVQEVLGLDAASTEARGSFDGPGSCDLAFSARLAFPTGETASLAASYLGEYAATHVVRCAGGTVTVSDFLRPLWGDYQVRLTLEQGGETRRWAVSGGGYYLNQMRAFLDAAEGAREPPPLAASLGRIRCMEGVYRQACAAAGIAGY